MSPFYSLQTIYHDPTETHIAVVTVGGICPGLNDVVRSIVHKVGAVLGWVGGWVGGWAGGWWWVGRVLAGGSGSAPSPRAFSVHPIRAGMQRGGVCTSAHKYMHALLPCGLLHVPGPAWPGPAGCGLWRA